MDKQTRIQKIEDIINREKDNPFGMQEIPWQDKLESMQVYKIPLSYLIYNKYNGRILSRTKSLEKQNHNIDVESEAGKKLIEQLLWDSKEDRNKKTEIDLKSSGQKKIGIITRDGIIIDGNRRAMLLNKIGKDDYFKAVILPVNLDEDIIAIQKLETSFQMGEDEKLGYNPIEKYLKARDLFEILITNNTEEVALSKIADWMGEQKAEIQDLLSVIKTMDEYLSEFKYDGIYTQLDGREDQFINLTKWLNTFYSAQSGKAFDGYKDDDVDDLKVVAFDYIRDKYEGKEFRVIAHGQKQNHFFGDSVIWETFRDSHFEITKNIQKSNIDYSSPNLKSHLDELDNSFSNDVHEKIKDNLESHYENLRNKQAGDKPEKLIRRSIESFDAIQQNHHAFGEENSQKLLEELASKTLHGLKKKSPVKILGLIKKLLEEIDTSEIPDENLEEARVYAKNIQHVLNDFRKEIE